MKKNIVFLIVSAVVLIVATILLFGKSKESADFEPVPSVAETVPDTAFSDSENDGGTLAKATFDIVRVEQDGSMVAAGKGTKNEEISLMDGDSLLSKIAVNEDGEGVFVPETPLPAGEHELWLRDSSNNSRNESEVVVVTVPERAGNAEALAVLMSSDAEEVTVLQAPDPLKHWWTFNPSTMRTAC